MSNLIPGGGQAGPGNSRSLTHGGYARVGVERLEAKAAEVFRALSEDAPLRGPDGGLPAADAAAVTLLARCLVRLESVGEYLDRRGWEDEDGEPRAAVELERRLRQEAADHLDSLGMSPRSRAKLGLDLQRGFDLSTAMSERDPERRAQMMREAGVEPEEAEDR
jgi:hypothetical protein